jgi:hypothetical protein
MADLLLDFFALRVCRMSMPRFGSISAITGLNKNWQKPRFI